MSASGRRSTRSPRAIRCRLPASPSAPGSIPPPSTSRSGCPPTAGRAGLDRIAGQDHRGDQFLAGRVLRAGRRRRKARPRGRCRRSVHRAAARLRAGRRRRLLRRCRLSGRPGLGPDRTAGAGGRRLLCAAGAGRFHAAALPRRRRADRPAGATVRKGDRVVVKTKSGEVMAKVLGRRTARRSNCLAQPRTPAPADCGRGCRVAGAHRLGEPVGGADARADPCRPALAIPALC